MTNGKITSVVVQPQAVTAMALHAIKHRNSSVHGILLGKSENGVTTVTDAAGVSHGAPTAVTVETALGLLVGNNNNNNETVVVVGWYTAPMLLEDTRPGPVALRMAANLASDKVEPVLLVVQNSVLVGEIMGQRQKEGGGAAASQGIVQALGRDFGNQWLDEIASTTIAKPEIAAQAIRQAVAAAEEDDDGIVLFNDLLDHYEDGTSSVWYPNKDLSQLIAKIE